ncbi:MAG: hypothetical protein WBY53_19220 [Acidobacteriaceae bacterium]
MFERYTQPARRAIFFARDEAILRGATAIAPVDLVLGLSREEYPPGSPLAALHENAAEIRSLLGVEPISESNHTSIDIPLTDASKRALAYATEEAERDASHDITAEHLLRGVLRLDDPTTSTLSAAGWTLKGMRNAHEPIPNPRATDQEPLPLILKIYGRVIVIAVFAVIVLAALFYFHGR